MKISLIENKTQKKISLSFIPNAKSIVKNLFIIINYDCLRNCVCIGNIKKYCMYAIFHLSLCFLASNILSIIFSRKHTKARPLQQISYNNPTGNINTFTLNRDVSLFYCSPVMDAFEFVWMYLNKEYKKKSKKIHHHFTVVSIPHSIFTASFFFFFLF